MTRFDAAAEDTRRELVRDAIAAHRERGSEFLTVEVTRPDDVLWVQYFDGTLNLDCTDAELERLKELVGDFPAFTIDELTSPEDAEGTNVRITAHVDDARVATFVDSVFRDVYECPADYRAWVVAV